MRRIAALFVIAVGALSASLATAQVPVPPGGAAAPPDVVMTNDGGMIRGTIIESTPGQYVVIALPTGETRRIEWSRVQHAGTAAGAPTPVAVQSAPSYGAGVVMPQPAPAPSGVPVRFASEQPAITFHRVTGTATGVAWSGRSAVSVRAFSFERLCTAPCERALEPGSYQLALSSGSGSEVVAEGYFDVTRPGTLSGEYVDQSALRIAGWITLIGGDLAGALMGTLPLLTSNSTSDDSWVGWLVAGGATILAGTIVGLILIGQNDGALIRFD